MSTQIFLSRTCNENMAALFSGVPEIYDRLLIISVANIIVRAKIAVLSKDKIMDWYMC